MKHSRNMFEALLDSNEMSTTGDSSSPEASTTFTSDDTIVPSHTDKAQTKKPTEQQEVAEDQFAKADIRTWNAKDRRWLTEDKSLVTLYKGKDIVVCRLPFRLFNAASNKAGELLEDTGRQVHLPDDVDEAGVLGLVQELKGMIFSKSQPGRMSGSGSTYKDLVVCGAAMLLGMELYTNHVYFWHRTYWKNQIISYSDLHALLNLPKSMDPGQKLFNFIANDLAVRYRENMIPDPVKFDAFLHETPRLAHAISNVNDSYDAWYKRKEKAQQRDKAAEKDRERQQAAQKRREEEVKERKKQDMARLADEGKREREIRASIQEKMKVAGKKFTDEERRFYMNEFGKRPPTGR